MTIENNLLVVFADKLVDNIKLKCLTWKSDKFQYKRCIHFTCQQPTKTSLNLRSTLFKLEKHKWKLTCDKLFLDVILIAFDTLGFSFNKNLWVSELFTDSNIIWKGWNKGMTQRSTSFEEHRSVESLFYVKTSSDKISNERRTVEMDLLSTWVARIISTYQLLILFQLPHSTFFAAFGCCKEEEHDTNRLAWSYTIFKLALLSSQLKAIVLQMHFLPSFCPNSSFELITKANLKTLLFLQPHRLLLGFMVPWFAKWFYYEANIFTIRCSPMRMLITFVLSL